MAFGNMAKAASKNAELQNIARVMSKRTQYPVSADMVTPVKGEDRMKVYSAQVGDVTVLCWNRGNDFVVKTVCW